MITRDIAAADRTPFFSQFSRLHAGALVTLRLGVRDEVVDQPFRGVSKDGADVVIHTGPVGYRIANTAAVALEQTDEGADAAVAIVSFSAVKDSITTGPS